jgi:NAD(P)H-hydrate epimerase
MPQAKIPAITTAEMREVDRLMIEVYGIELMQMMENAGRNLAALARSRFLDGQAQDKDVIVLAGKGGNGGGGLVAARRLHNWGARVHVFITHPVEAFQGVPAHQLAVLENMSVPIQQVGSLNVLPPADLILDALIGYSLSGAPRGAAAVLIALANQSHIPILSLDTPSGLDTTSGEAYQPHIMATATLTLALPKKGLVAQEARPIVGKLFLADISVPPGLYKELGLDVGHLFQAFDIISLH